jgi:hypothetical protein
VFEFYIGLRLLAVLCVWNRVEFQCWCKDLHDYLVMGHRQICYTADYTLNNAFCSTKFRTLCIENKTAMDAYRNVEALSCNHCCTVQAISVITYSKCVFVAVGIQHTMRICHIAICGLPVSRIFFSLYLINGTIFEKKSIWT